MRSLKMALIALMLTMLFGTPAKARDHAVNGLIIGTAVGGMVGYIVGNELDRDNYGRRYAHHRQVVYLPPPPPPQYYSHRPYYNDRDHYRNDRRDDWHRPHHHRGPYRHDRYENHNRW